MFKGGERDLWDKTSINESSLSEGKGGGQLGLKLGLASKFSYTGIILPKSKP